MDACDLDKLPDVRDGLTRTERIVLYCIHQLQKERDGRNVPTAMLYGRVVEHVDMSENELQDILQRLTSSS
jgi:DNA gyrase/topoisomerase IV subunit A